MAGKNLAGNGVSGIALAGREAGESSHDRAALTRGLKGAVLTDQVEPWDGGGVRCLET